LHHGNDLGSILQAILGRFMPLEVIYHRNLEQAKEAYVLYYRLRPARVVSFFVLVMLPVFEVCKNIYPKEYHELT
jgi:two pore calcium channel protein